MACCLRKICTFANIEIDVKDVIIPEKNGDLINYNLSDCLISISPLGEFVAFASQKIFAVYNLDDDIPPKIKFVKSENAFITSISFLFIPSYSHRKKSGYLFFLVGFDDGIIKFFDEDGALIFSKKFDSEPIISIKPKFFYEQPKRFLWAASADHLLIVLKTKFIIIEGHTLYPFLRNITKSTILSTNDITQQIKSDYELVFKRYNLHNFQKLFLCQVHDLDTAYFIKPSFYDQLFNQSFSGPKIKPNDLLVISTGNEAFAAWHTASEDLNSNVTGLLKNSLNWFSDISRSGTLSTNLTLFDKNRLGTNVTISPNKLLAAVCDHFGRVSLISLQDNLVIRMWKGYRDAQCGWIEALEDIQDKNSKRCLFLCIYLPRRALLEVWLCQLGPRVGAFNTGKDCKLLYCEISLSNYVQNEFKYSSCYLIDYQEGTISKVEVPFHLSLVENQDEILDSLLMKEFFKLQENSFQAFWDIFKKVKSYECRWQMLEFLIQKQNLTLLESILNKNLNDSVDVAPYKAMLDKTCKALLKLLKFYNNLKIIHNNLEAKNHESNSDEIENPVDFEAEADILKWPTKYFNKCFTFFCVLQNTEEIESSFITFEQFLTLVIIKDEENCNSNKKPSDNIKDLLYLKNYKKVSFKTFVEFGNLILIPVIKGDLMEEILSVLEESSLSFNDLILPVYASWLNGHFYTKWVNWKKFSSFIKNLVRFDDCDLKLSIKQIIVLINQSSIIGSALTAALVLKDIFSCFEKVISANKDFESEETLYVLDDWETLSLSEERFNQLFNQLEHVFFLSHLMAMHPNMKTKEITLQFLLESNADIVSELVAKCIALNQFKPSFIMKVALKNENDQGINDIDKDLDLDLSLSYKSENNLDQNTLESYLKKLVQYFPYSLESEVLLANCCWESLNFWENEPSLNTIDFLTQSCLYLGAINNAVLKQNLGCLIWKKFISQRLQTLSELIEKMGKQPKDRICRKSLGIGEELLEIFTKYALDLLDLLINNISNAAGEPLPLFRIDDWWDNRNLQNDKLPLVLLAVQQPAPNPLLLLEVHHLVLSIHMIITYQMKGCRPLSLFPCDIKPHLFGDLSFQITYSEAILTMIDSSIQEKRLNFLISIVSAIAKSIPPSNEETKDSYLETRMYLTASQWFGNIATLCRDWDLDVDEIRSHYIFQLYSNGCDSLAKDMILSICNQEQMAQKLLIISTNRIFYLLGDKLMKYLASLTYDVAKGLQKIEQINFEKKFQISSTQSMVEYLMLFSQNNNNLQRYSKALFDMLQEYVKNECNT